MQAYLVIITTALVLTQIIKLIQNTIHFAMQSKAIKQGLETDPNKQLLRLWDKLEEALDIYLDGRQLLIKDERENEKGEK